MLENNYCVQALTKNQVNGQLLKRKIAEHVKATQEIEQLKRDV